MLKHRFNIFPEMQPEDYERLKHDIDVNDYDVRSPIWFYEGAILDGWNRERACKELGMEPVYAEFIGSDTEAIEFVMRTNNRRDLTSSQRACIAIEAEEIIKVIRDEARQKKEEGRNQYSPVQLIAQADPEDNKTRTKVAELFQTNRTYFNEAQRLKDDKPELFEAVKRGYKTITEVKKEEKIEDRKRQIEEVKKTIESENLTIKGEYDVIAIDPPWNYGREYDPDNSRVANPYPEMTTDEISKIKLPLKDNAVVFLWTTHAFIRDAFKLIDIWELNYKAIITWDKDKMGMGNTVRMQCEFCLLCVKGSPLIEGSSERDIIREQRREHSRKPESFYELVERITTGRRLDYFARSKRINWDVYGAETEKF